MSRNLYLPLFAFLLVSGFFFLIYKTPAQLTKQASLPPFLGERVGEFSGVSLSIEYATTSETRERGLGGRENVPEDYGMLFVFPNDDEYAFWMKDMLVPLDIFWLDDKGQVVYIMEDVAISTYPSVFYPTSPARYVLETAAGFARAHAIATGTPLMLKSFPTVSQ